VDRTAIAPPDGAFCGLGRGARVYKELVSYGEEAAISPTWLIDLAGCSLRCPFCTEWPHITRPHDGPAAALTSAWFHNRLVRRAADGAATVSFVGGEPTVNLLAILEALAPTQPSDAVAEPRAPTAAPDSGDQTAPPAATSEATPGWLPVVWNTNGLIAPDALMLLRGVVSCFVVDLKAGPATPGRTLGAGTMPTFEQVTSTIETLCAWPTSSYGPARADGRVMPRLIVRHLLMPGRVQADTIPVLDWLAARAPSATVNLMTRYLPMGPALRGAATPPWMRRTSTRAERQAGVEAAHARIPRDRLWIDGRPS
jgi:uncharacterized Fe-S radical SAM superfamily protein PflX